MDSSIHCHKLLLHVRQWQSFHWRCCCFPCLRSGPRLSAHSGGGKELTDQMLPAALCQPWGEAAAWGLQQLSRQQFTLQFRACVSHYLSFSFLRGKICESQRMQRCKRAVHIIIVLIRSLCRNVRLPLIYSCRSPGAPPSCPTFSCTHLCQQNICTSAAEGLTHIGASCSTEVDVFQWNWHQTRI